MLYVVATPIGNLEDFSPRGVRTLTEVDWIACEDTRHTRKLLNHFGITTRTTSYHEFNEEQKTPQLLQQLKAGQNGALVSDAGTPLLSDPGYRLVRQCRKAGIEVRSIPGPNAAVAALSVAGIATDSFRFVGFPPKRAGQRIKWLEELRDTPSTLVFYVTPHQLRKNLEDIRRIMGDREAVLAAEVTKLHERYVAGRVSEIIDAVSEEKPRGEYTLVVEAAPRQADKTPSIDVEAYLLGLMEKHGSSRRDAARRAAEELGLSRKETYRILGDR